jgi:crotonobetainyl-CoA:carnitine CoA-transferase CaiB-like acyl-CoA transferase
MGGIRHTTGEPDRPPARTGISLGDSLAALFAVVGALAALQERQRSGRGQEVDVAIYEAVLALMESTVADYELADVMRTRRGGVLNDVAPANAYPTADGRAVVIAGNADAVFARLCDAMQRPDLARDLTTHEARAERQEWLDAEIAAWTAGFAADGIIALLQSHDVPVGPINRAPELLADPHISARDMIVRLAAGFERPVPMVGVVPKLSRTPGEIRHAGPALGEHTDEVLRELAGCSDDEIETLRNAGVCA